MHVMLRGAPLLLAAALAACAGARAAPDFRLRDDTGNPWILSQQRGKAVLLTFGFTHCADTCPATLAKLTRVAASLRAPSPLVIAFVTVDPHRDTVAVLHRFVGHFPQRAGSAIAGLTGDPSQLAAVEAAYHVWSTTNHTIAHSSVIFLIDARGRLRGTHDDDDSVASLTRSVAGILGS
jgi:protein SCO1/2